MIFEKIRRWIRRILGYESATYQMAAAMADNFCVLRHEGWKVWHVLATLNKQTDSELSVRLSKLRHPIVLRPHTKDVSAIISNCIREEYGQFLNGLNPRFIIDAGAYIGDVAAYFLSRFADCHLVAIEPNNVSFERCRRNLEPYGPRAELVKAALYDSITTLSFGGADIGARIGPGEQQVATITVPAILSRAKFPSIDILKMDIEGAERVVLRSGDRSWLSAVGLVILETHGTADAELLPLLERNGFHCTEFRSLYYCKKL